VVTLDTLVVSSALVKIKSKNKRPWMVTLSTTDVLLVVKLVKSNKTVFLTPSTPTLAPALVLGAEILHQPMSRTASQRTTKSLT